MKDFVIQLASLETVRIQTRPSGDLELVKSTTIPDGQKDVEKTEDEEGNYVERDHALAPGVDDRILSVVPKEKRAALAHFIATA